LDFNKDKTMPDGLIATMRENLDRSPNRPLKTMLARHAGQHHEGGIDAAGGESLHLTVVGCSRASRG
jgi:hypothetical protein